MPKRPKQIVKNRQGKLEVNRHAVAGRGIRQYGNPELIEHALRFWLEDVEEGTPFRGRYNRVRERIVTSLGASHDAAEDAIRGARSYTADKFAEELPVRVAEISDQLQRIADNAEAVEPAAAVAALRELGKLNGLYAPKKIEVSPEAAPLDLAVLVAVLDAEGRAALDVVIGQYEAARAAGKLQLPEGDVLEAELVDEPGQN